MKFVSVLFIVIGLLSISTMPLFAQESKNYTEIINQKFKGENCPYEFCDVLVNVIFEGNNTIFLEGGTKTLIKDTKELTFSDILFQSIELLKQDKFNIVDFENIGDGQFQVLLTR